MSHEYNSNRSTPKIEVIITYVAREAGDFVATEGSVPGVAFATERSVPAVAKGPAGTSFGVYRYPLSLRIAIDFSLSSGSTIITGPAQPIPVSA